MSAHAIYSDQKSHTESQPKQQPDARSNKQLPKKPPCFYFNRPGGCRFGNACKFAHDDKADSSAPSSSSTTGSGNGGPRRREHIYREFGDQQEITDWLKKQLQIPGGMILFTLATGNNLRHLDDILDRDKLDGMAIAFLLDLLAHPDLRDSATHVRI